jgi:sporulation-control protein spo0M
MRISSIAKSLIAGLAAGAAAAVTAVQDNVITTGESVTMALAILGAWGVTYAVPNRKSEGLG